MRARTTLGAAAVAAAMLLAACGTDTPTPSGGAPSDTPAAPPAAPGTPEEPSGPTGTLVVAQAGEWESPDPILDGGYFSVNKYRVMYDQLFYMSPDGELLPRIVTDWEANEDGSAWSMTIREDIVFHDGEPLTVDDVIYSIDTVITTEGSRLQIYTGRIEEIERTSDTVVTFHLNAPAADFPRTIYYLSVVPEHAYEELGPEGFAAAPIGSGPYRFVSWTDGVEVVFEANEDYWGEPPRFETVRVLSVPDGNARVNGLLSGAIDVAPISPEQVDIVNNTPGYSVAMAPGNQTVYLSFNVANPILDNADFRRAVNHAIDREAITENILGGLASPLGQSAPSVVIGHDPTIEAVEYDPDLARELLEASGYAGETIPFAYPTDGNILSSSIVAQAVAQYLGEIGINLDLRGIDNASFSINSREHRHEGIFFTQFSPNAMDAASTLNFIYRTSGYAYFEDDEIEALIVQAGASPDPTDRQAVLSQIWQRNRDQAYVIDLYTSQNLVGLADGFDYVPRGDGQVYPVDVQVVG